MSNQKLINSRVQLKYDSYKNWVEKNPSLLSGEVAIAYLPPRPEGEHTNPAPSAVASATLIKVGPGQFNALPWLSATAADVYAWAKQESLPIVRATDDGTEGNVISGISWDAANNKIVYTTASVATSEGMQDLQDAIDAVEKDIEDNRAKWEKNTTYTFAQNGKSLTVTPSDGEGQTFTFAYLTQSEIEGLLASYYTKGEIDTMVNGKLHTQSEIEGYIDSALSAVSGTDAIEGITTLVEYVNTHGADLAAITKEIYGDTGKVGDDPSRIDTAVANAASAVETANSASGVANAASGVANEAKELAQSAKETAETAQGSASASADDARKSMESAQAAQEAAEAAQAAAEGARDTALEHKNDARQSMENAQAAQAAAEQAKADALTYAGNAEQYADNAFDQAEDAKSYKEAAATSESNARQSAEDASAAKEAAAGSATAAAGSASNARQSAENASAAKEAAVAAKEAAEASNTSATAIANEAKGVAEAAKSASDAATQAVAGLHEVATSGSVYDLNEVGTAKNSQNAEVPCLIFYCGTASDLV